MIEARAKLDAKKKGSSIVDRSFIHDGKEAIFAELKNISVRVHQPYRRHYYFEPLTKEQTRKIVDIQLDRTIERLEKKGVVVTISKDARDWLATHGYDQAYGARPLKRLINPTFSKIRWL